MRIATFVLAAMALGLFSAQPLLAQPYIIDGFGNDDLASTAAPDAGTGFSTTGTQGGATVIEADGIVTLTSDGGWNISTMRSNDLFPWYSGAGTTVTWDILSSQIGDTSGRQFLGVLGSEFPGSAPNPENTNNAPAAYVKLGTNDGNAFQGAIMTTTSDGGVTTLDTWDWSWDGLGSVSVSFTVFAGGWKMSATDGTTRMGDWSAVTGTWDESVWGAGGMASVQVQGAGIPFVSELDRILVEPASVITLLGDFNNDAVINTADYDILANNFLIGNQYAQGDLTFDGKVNLADFKAFKAIYPAAGNLPVPEPTTGVLLACGGLAWALGRRWRKG
jgi:hypothetical protein